MVNRICVWKSKVASDSRSKTGRGTASNIWFQYYVDPLVSFPSSSSFSHMKSSLLRDNKKDDGPRILGARNVTCCRKIHEISSKEEEKNGATRNHSRNRASFLAISKHVSVMRNVSKEYISFPHSARTFEIRRFNDRIFL